MSRLFAIVGAGPAGVAAAESLRSAGFDGRVVLVGGEEHLPYARPPLSKAVLRGETPAAKIALRPTQWYSENGIEIELGTRATRLLPGDHRLELASGRALRYDKVLLATGGSARVIPVPGVGLDGVHTLRTVDDALGIAETLRPGVSVVIIGAGFIGLEVAASASTMGARVTVLEAAGHPLSRVLGPEIGNALAAVHRSHGVELRLGCGLREILGSSTVRQVVADDGTVIEADVVVLGVGLSPDLALGVAAGCRVGDGLVVDERCATSIPDVYAAGDIAYHPNPYAGGHIRLEQWQNAQRQGASAGRAMLGQGEAYSEVPWFWSDQFDRNLQMAGLPGPGDDIVVRGDVRASEFSVHYLRDGVLRAVVGVNRALDVRTGRRLIRQRARMSLDLLADESVDIASAVNPTAETAAATPTS